MFDDLKEYINNRISYAKLEIVDSVSNMFAASVFGILAGMFVMLAFFAASLAVGFLLGNWFDNIGMGFLVLFVVDLLILAVLLLFRKRIMLYLTDKAVKAAMDAIDTSDEDEEEEKFL
ncbi:MAG: phage holin family protein [Weeksellaceae bacterium]|mgnify:CR=1 FL=1|jgi:hypothetical protein|nr:phage holin family protein [Weeksellaceae bacterium]